MKKKQDHTTVELSYRDASGWKISSGPVPSEGFQNDPKVQAVVAGALQQDSRARRLTVRAPGKRTVVEVRAGKRRKKGKK